MNTKLNKPFLFLLILFRLFLPEIIAAQEALKSAEEEYYDFLALQGLAERPYLNYRTLSDSVWTIDENAEHPWQEQNLGFPRYFFDGRLKLKIYGPELFNSVNTAAPYGQNDGALWQGKGYNGSFTAGVRLEAYGVEATFKPQLAFSQNAAFDIMPSVYENEYGYFWGYGVDAPQRFGDKPFFTWDWGDSEIRYTWKTLTAGFGTQAIWLGPAYLNPILHSNNAPTYPKFDIGLRRQPITIPWINWYAGDIEARIWVGYQSESDYFDSDPSNDYVMFHGLSFAYAPSFLPGLSLSANRVCLVPWEWENLKYVIPIKQNEFEDQKFSLTFSWLLLKSDFELYGELMIDDYMGGGSSFLAYMRHPFEAISAYTIGLKKAVQLSLEKKLYGEIIFELNWLEMSQTQQFSWPYSPYFHHQLKHGYTNRGQFLGNSSSSGGNSQYLKFILYYPKGNFHLTIARNNPDNNYIYQHAINASNQDGSLHARWSSVNKANFIIGILTNYFLNNTLATFGGFTYDLIINPHYKRTTEYYADGNDIYWHNISLQAGLKFQF
jgi:hypothetical protein